MPGRILLNARRVFRVLSPWYFVGKSFSDGKKIEWTALKELLEAKVRAETLMEVATAAGAQM